MEDVVQRVSAAAPDVLADEPVVFAVLFGSRAAGTARDDSDTDVAVLLTDDVLPSQYLDVQLRLVRCLSRASGVGDIDLVVLNDAPLPLRGRVVGSGVPLYSADEPARVEYVSRTFREYVDVQALFAGLDRELLRQIALGER